MLKIQAEGLPTRCDICHQTDHFDPTRNHCHRCGDLGLVLLKPIEPDTAPPAAPVDLGIVNIFRVLVILLVTTSWGFCVGCSIGALIKSYFKSDILCLIVIAGGTITGLAQGVGIGYKALMDRYRAFNEIHT